MKHGPVDGGEGDTPCFVSAPTVTVIVPTYRRLRYLKEALPSAISQTYHDFELIVSDDGASDEIAEYVASLGDLRLRYRRNQRNLGIAMNNLAAFSEARGKYIASLHDDDIWDPGFLEALVPPLEADDEISVAFCDHHVIDGEGRILPEVEDWTMRTFHRDKLAAGRHQPFLKSAVVDLSIPMVMSAVFRKSILEDAEYPRRIGGSYDLWLAYLAVKNGQACYYVPKLLTWYRDHDESGTSRRGIRNFQNAIYVRRKFLCDASLAAWHPEISHQLGLFYGKLALYYLSLHSYWRGKILLRAAFSLMNRPKNKLALFINAVWSVIKP